MGVSSRALIMFFGRICRSDGQYLLYTLRLYSHPPQAVKLQTLRLERNLCCEHNTLLLKGLSVSGYTAALGGPEGVPAADQAPSTAEDPVVFKRQIVPDENLSCTAAWDEKRLL